MINKQCLSDLVISNQYFLDNTKQGSKNKYGVKSSQTPEIQQEKNCLSNLIFLIAKQHFLYNPHIRK